MGSPTPGPMVEAPIRRGAEAPSGGRLQLDVWKPRQLNNPHSAKWEWLMSVVDQGHSLEGLGLMAGGTGRVSRFPPDPPISDRRAATYPCLHVGRRARGCESLSRVRHCRLPGLRRSTRAARWPPEAGVSR